MGVNSYPTRFTLGLGLQQHRWRIDMAGERHHFLGWTPAISLNLLW
jgi:hypothetical protein